MSITFTYISRQDSANGLNKLLILACLHSLEEEKQFKEKRTIIWANMHMKWVPL